MLRMPSLYLFQALPFEIVDEDRVLFSNHSLSLRTYFFNLLISFLVHFFTSLKFYFSLFLLIINLDFQQSFFNFFSLNLFCLTPYIVILSSFNVKEFYFIFIEFAVLFLLTSFLTIFDVIPEFSLNLAVFAPLFNVYESHVLLSTFFMSLNTFMILPGISCWVQWFISLLLIISFSIISTMTHFPFQMIDFHWLFPLFEFWFFIALLIFLFTLLVPFRSFHIATIPISVFFLLLLFPLDVSLRYLLFLSHFLPVFS